MIKKYSQLEMLNIWKRKLGLKSSYRSVGISDLSELDKRLLQDIDAWYDEVLHSAPVEKLPREDLAGEAYSTYLTDNSVQVLLPARGIRLVAVKLREWEVEESETVSPWSDTARLQRNKLTRATSEDPVIVARPGKLILHGIRDPYSEEEPSGPIKVPGLAKPELQVLEMVVRPEDGSYVMDQSILRHIFD